MEGREEEEGTCVGVKSSFSYSVRQKEEKADVGKKTQLLYAYLLPVSLYYLCIW